MSTRGVVLLDDFREAEVRPRDLFEDYVRLLRSDIARFFGPSELRDISCPGCGEGNPRPAFQKIGLTYVECGRCLSVYLRPRPRPEALEAYYREGDSVKFWDTVVMKETDAERREHVFQRRLDWLTDFADQLRPRPRRIVDWNAKYRSFFEEILRARAFDSIVALNPASRTREACPALGIEIAEFPGTELRESLITAFEVLEREFDPAGFLRTIHGALVGRGLLFLTTRSISGFDLGLLREKAKNILPPIHMNLLSLEAITRLLSGAGFEILELSTPGQLDVEIVRNAMAEDSGLQLPPFISYLLRQRDADAHRSLQEFLQRYRLSSHVRVVAQKI